MQCPIFNLTFQIVIYQPTPSNNYNIVVPQVLLLYCNISGIVLDKDQPHIAQFPLGIINWKHINVITIK